MTPQMRRLVEQLAEIAYRRMKQKQFDQASEALNLPEHRPAA